ncbi:MAG TPA: universal stress protein [Rubrobacter sp.]|jgi:nucleotide-binding universal stress UspA family protein|nr:universal stress protein [Rubrobacter sp.]
MSHFPTKILLATDGSKDAFLALRAAVDLSARTGSELHVVHAWLPFPDHSHPSIAVAPDAALYEREAQKLLFEELDKVEAAGGAASGGHLERGRPAETISDLAEELEVGLVVVGSRGLGPVMRLVMGSVSEAVIDLATCPVLVLRGGEGAWPPSRVVVGDDSSPGAKGAGDLAASIAGIVGASVLLVRAVPMVRDVSEAARFVEDAAALPHQATLGRHELFLAARARRLEEASGLRPRVRVRGGEAASSLILEAAEEGEGPPLIAVGRRGLGPLERLRLGSVSTKVLRAAMGPVLVIPS